MLALNTEEKEIQNKRKLQKKRRTKRTLFVNIIFFILIFGVGIGTYFFWQVDETINKITVNPEDKLDLGSRVQIPPLPSKVSAKEEQPVPEKVTRQNVLILGLDYRPGIGTRNTDVIMVASFDSETKTGALFSIPRDTKVFLGEENTYVKANYVYLHGEKKVKKNKELSGLTQAKETMSQFLDIPIDHAVMIDFKAFVDVINELGGIEIDVEKSMEYDDPTDETHIHLSRGVQVLNGKQALDYVRHRLDNRGEAYYSSDFDRNVRQQKVVRHILDKVSSFEGVKNFTGLLQVAGDNIYTDYTRDQLLDTIWKFIGFKPSNLTTIDNQAYWDSKAGASIIPKEVMQEIKELYDHP